jgi:hypothetical protein
MLRWAHEEPWQRLMGDSRLLRVAMGLGEAQKSNYGERDAGV